MEQPKNSPEVKAFIRQNADLFWYVPKDKKEDVSHELLVEMVLNYGNRKMIRELFDLLGLENVARIFFEQSSGQIRSNYLKPTKNYFQLYFNRHAHGNTDRRTA